MTRIADALKHEGPIIMRHKKLPAQIEASLDFAVSSVNPNKASTQANLKHGLSLLAGSGGLTLAAIFLGQLVNPGAWAIIVTFFVGGIAGGPVAIIGVAGGLLLVTGSIYAAYQKMTPHERAVKAHEFVMKGIDNWIQNGGSEDVMPRPVPSEHLDNMKPERELPESFSEQELSAADAILKHVSSCDGDVSEAELRMIEDAIGIMEEAGRLDYKEAIKLIKTANLEKRKEVVAWCFGVAYSDKSLHPKEDETLRDICSKLEVDYDSFLEIFSVKR
jgi:uncharacterized tellurite resistance protein B-like protein